MKHKSLKLLTALSIIVFLLFTLIRCSLTTFDSRDVKKNISYLSSSEFEGRMPGSSGNAEAANYIEKTFQNIGLSPFNNEFQDTFNLISPYLNGNSPKLFLKDSKGNSLDFNYGVDFKEDMINFKESTATLSFKDKHKVTDDTIIINQNGNIFLFYLDKEGDFDFRSSFTYESPVSFAVSLNKETFNSVKVGLDKGDTLEIALPYSIKTSNASNVIGVIEGKYQNEPPLILTAHFDHLGTDYLGNTYGGALDNASGTSFLLELSEVFKSYPKPNRDIIFVALNGEEFGLLGSENFSSKYKDRLNSATVINFDMIGADTNFLTLMKCKGTENLKTPLENSLISISQAKNVNTNVTYEDASDHVPFSKLGFDSLTLTHSDTSKIHTPSDTLEFISESAIDDAYFVVSKYILDNCYSKSTRILYNYYIHITSFLISLLLVGYHITLKVKNSKYFI